MDDAVRQLALNLGWTPAAAVAALLAVLTVGWIRDRRGRMQRHTLQRFYKLGEQLTAGRSFSESLRLLQTVLPELITVTDVRVYVPDRESKTLQRLEVDPGSGISGQALLAEESSDFLKQSVLLCYRNRSSIAVPDTRRSPLFEASRVEQAPRSALFLPMFAQEDLLGVLAISDAKRLWHFSEEERALAQHLANQLAIGMKLLEQKSLREHALGGDRLSAVHRLIASAASELKQPLARMIQLVDAGPGRDDDAAAELPEQARKAAEALDRLLKLARMDSDEESAVDLAATLRALMEERRHAWREKGIEVQDLIGAEPLVVSSKGGAIPQVLSSLMWHIGERPAKSPAREIRLRAFRLAAMVHAEFGWLPLESESGDFDVFEQTAETGSVGVRSLRDCRDLVKSHGGQLRFIPHKEGNCRLELEIPARRADATAIRAEREDTRALTPLTAIVLDSNPSDQRALISALCDLGHRSVPAFSAEEAVELAGRMHFDVLFCSASVPGTSWPECYESTRHHVRSFVLLTPGRDAALSAALEQDGPRTLAKPVRLDELDQCLRDVATRSIVSRG